MARKKLTIPKLIKKADRIFSKMIRLQAADAHGNCVCVSCGRIRSWKQMHAGHFASRKYAATRFSPLNVFVQCPYCNSFCNGNSAGFASYIKSKFGANHIDAIWNLAKQSHKWDREQLEKLIEVCTEKVKELQKAKGLY